MAEQARQKAAQAAQNAKAAAENTAAAVENGAGAAAVAVDEITPPNPGRAVRQTALGFGDLGQGFLFTGISVYSAAIAFTKFRNVMMRSYTG